LSSLTAIFGNSEENSQDSDKLMDLYWNRAELKKAFAGMREEQYRLQDRIKEQEGATARLQQKLDHLESLLVDPEWAHNVVVYYRFRGLGHRCEGKLAIFAEQLKQQREQKKHDSALVDWNEQREDEARQIKTRLLEKHEAIHQLEDRLQAEQRQLTSMSSFRRMFRGRSVMKSIDDIAERIESAVQEMRSLQDDLDDATNREPPDHQGLDVDAKRSINLMIIAFAQQLYIHFADDGIAGLVKEATEKSVGAINYGNQYECEQLLKKIQTSVEKLERATDFVDVLQRRAQLLGEIAQFSGPSDAVPISGTVATVFRIDPNGLVSESDRNIVGRNYWAISKVFSR